MKCLGKEMQPEGVEAPAAGDGIRLRMYGEGVVSRRGFVQSCAAVALAAGLGLRPTEVHALSSRPRPVRGRKLSGDEVSYPIPAIQGVEVDRQNEVLLVREGDVLYAFALSCPHQRSLLKWREKDQQFRCTKHGSKYELSGEYVSGRATRAMDRLAIRIDGGKVVVDPSTLYQRDEQPDLWEAASVTIG